MTNEEMLMIPCSINSFRGMADKSIKVIISTQELSPVQISMLSELWIGGYGIMFFKKEEFSFDDKKIIEQLKIDSIELGRKTHSERLRNVLFILHAQDTEGHSSFDTYYASKMEKIIAHYKSKIK